MSSPQALCVLSKSIIGESYCPLDLPAVVAVHLARLWHERNILFVGDSLKVILGNSVGSCIESLGRLGLGCSRSTVES